MIHVVFAIQCGDVRPSEGAATLVAKQSKSAEVVGLAERIQAFSLLILGREEFGRNDLATILGATQLALNPCRVTSGGGTGRRAVAVTHAAFEAVQVKCTIQGAHKLACERLPALLTYPHLAASRPGGSRFRSVPLSAASGF